MAGYLARLPLLLMISAIIAGTCAAQEPKKPPVMRLGRDRNPDVDAAPPKYNELELPSAEEMLKIKPFDWIVLKNQDTLVVEPVSPRPDTLAVMNSDYERYLKGRAGMVEGEDRLKDKRIRFLKLQVTLTDPGPDQESDYLIDTKFIQRIEYFDDLLLRRASELVDDGRIPLAYDLLLLVDRRNRENNVRLTDAYETLKQEEAAARADEERIRFSVPELFPLRTYKTWPKFDEVYQKLLMRDGVERTKRGQFESALTVFENLWDRNAAYPDLPDRLSQAVDQLITSSVERSDFRQARHFLGRLSVRDAQHPIAVKWKAELLSRSTKLVAEARDAGARGDAPLASRLIELAARAWPETPGLRDAHRDLTDRYQSVRVGVLRLSGEPTKYPLETPADAAANALMDQVLFEPVRVDDRGVRYRSALLDSWEPTDLGRQVEFTLRLKRADWEARPLITAVDVLNELTRRIDPSLPTYDERLAEVVERVSVQSPSQFTVNFRHLPLRLEALMQFTVSLGDQSLALNPDLPAGAIPLAGRQRFYEFERDQRQVTYRRVRPQPSTSKVRYVDEIVEVKYDSWDKALQGMMRGEIAAIPQVGFKDLKNLKSDNRFFVQPYALPTSHFLLFNPASAPLRDTQLRRALSLALPRKELLERFILADVTEPYARIVATPFPTVSYGANRMLTEPPYDPQRSAALALTAKKILGGTLPPLRLVCPSDPVVREVATEMIEHWRRVGITVRLNDDSIESKDHEWDLIYCTTKITEPLTEIWPLLTMKSDASVESLKPLPERVRRQLLELERTSDWPSAIKGLHRIEAELLLETRYIPLWEADEYFVARRHLIGLPAAMTHSFHDVERWKLQSWYPTENPW